jgi:cell division protein FtsQ
VTGATRTALRRRPAQVVPAGPRRAARARADRSVRRSRRLRRLGQGLLLLVPLAVVGWVLLGSSWLAVDRVALSGLGRLSEQQLRAAVDVEPGTPLARVDTGAVAAAVRELPAVASVEVERSWPGTLRVAVREREVAAGVQRDGRIALVDADGVAFASEPGLPPGVVRLEVEDAGPDDAATRAALAVTQALPPDLRRRVLAVSVDEADRVVLRLDGDQRIVWGAPGETATKAAAAAALLKTPGSVVDVSTPGLVVRR